MSHLKVIQKSIPPIILNKYNLKDLDLDRNHMLISHQSQWYIMKT